MKRFILILCTALVAAPLAIMTMPKSTRKAPDSTEAGMQLIESDAGEFMVQKPLGIRAKAAMLVEAAASEQKWMKDFELTERSGRPFHSQELLGMPYIASFFFSSCPSICVLQNDQVRLLQEKFRDTPIRLVSISVDPEVDTPEVLTAYAKRVGAEPEKWFFLTGEFDMIQRVSTEVYFHSLPQPRFHQEKLFLMDAKGKLAGAYSWRDSKELDLLSEHVSELLESKRETTHRPN